MIYNSWQSNSKITSFRNAQELLNKPKALAEKTNYEEAYQGYDRLATGDELKNYPELQAEASFRAAYNLRMLDRLDEALDRYNNFMTQFPESQWVDNALYLIGVLNFYNLSNYAACRDALGTLLDKHPKSPFKESSQRLIKESFLKEAQALLAEEKYEDAYREFNRLASGEEFKDYPDLQTEARSKATYSFLKQIGKDDEKLIPYIDFLTESSETQFVEDNALFNIGLLSFKLRNYKESLRAFEQLRENLSDSDLKATALYNIGMANFHLQNYEDCQRALTEFLSQFPESALKEKALYNRGSAHYKLEDYEDSRADFRKLLDSFPNSELKDITESWVAQSFIEEAKLLLEAEKYELAYQEFDRLIASGKFKDYSDLQAEAMYRVAYSLKQLGLEKESKASNATVLGDIDQVEAFNNQKVIAYAEALNRYADFIAQFRENQYVIDAYIDSGDLHLRQAAYDNARAKYEEALKRTDNLAWQATIRSLIGNTYYDQGDFKNAISAYTTLLEEHPKSDFVVEAKLQIADSHFRLQQWNEAISAYSRVMIEHEEVKEHFPRCCYQIAEAYYKLAIDKREKISAFTKLAELIEGPPEDQDNQSQPEDEEIQLDPENQSQFELEMAEYWYRKILEDFPTDEVAPYALHGIIWALNDLGHKGELERLVLEHGISSPMPISNTVSDIDLTGLSYFKLALNQEEYLKDYEEALESYQKAIPRLRNPLIMAQSYYRLGLIYQDKLDPPDENKALEMFQTLVSEYGNSENPSTVSIVADAHIRLSELLGRSIPEEEKRDLIDQRALGSTVLLVMKNSKGYQRGSGSGFFVGPGLIATNYHVVRGAAGGHAEIVGENTTSEEKTKFDIQGYTAVNKERDLVILKVSGISPPELPLGNSENMGCNDSVYAVGTPLGRVYLKGTISPGSISKIHKDTNGNQVWLQHNAPTYPGNSGCPVLNRDGEVIGIHTATEGFRDQSLNVHRAHGIHFAIPSNDLLELLKKVSKPKPLRQIELSAASHAVQ